MPEKKDDLVLQLFEGLTTDEVRCMGTILARMLAIRERLLADEVATKPPGSEGKKPGLAGAGAQEAPGGRY